MENAVDRVVIVITGASRGLGAAIALEYAGPGVRLCLVGRDRDGLARVADACAVKGAEAEVLVADVTDEERIRSALGEFDARHPVDLLVANAGVTSGLHDLDRMEQWEGVRQAAEVNFCGTLNSVHPILERMIDRGRGQVAVIGSLAANPFLPYSPAYSAAKAGIETYALALRPWAAERGVKVNIVSPGYVETRMSGRLTGPKPGMMSAERAARHIRKALGRNRARAAFPRHLDIGVRLLGFLPSSVRRLIVPFFAFTVRSAK